MKLEYFGWKKIEYWSDRMNVTLNVVCNGNSDDLAKTVQFEVTVSLPEKNYPMIELMHLRYQEMLKAIPTLVDTSERFLQGALPDVDHFQSPSLSPLP